MDIDLFLMSGQSNMQGQSEGFVQHQLPKEVGFEYKALTDSLEKIKHPSGEDILLNGVQLLLKAHQGFNTLVPSFAENYYAKSKRKACYVHAAKGATAINEWQKGTERYDALLRKMQGAVLALKNEGYNIIRKNLVWLQGESDGIIKTSKEEYKRHLLSLWTDLNKDLQLENCLVIRIAKFDDFPCFPIMKAQEELCHENEEFCMLTRITQSFSIENGLMQGETAPFHYTNKGYDLVGKKAGQNAAAYLNGQSFKLENECYPL